MISVRHKKLLSFLIILAGVLITAALIGEQWRANVWERHLGGPYPGIPFTDTITPEYVSMLQLPQKGRLEVHQAGGTNGLVLVRRGQDGAVVWAQLLTAESNGSKIDIKEIKLHS